MLWVTVILKKFKLPKKDFDLQNSVPGVYNDPWNSTVKKKKPTADACRPIGVDHPSNSGDHSFNVVKIASHPGLIELCKLYFTDVLTFSDKDADTKQPGVAEDSQTCQGGDQEACIRWEGHLDQCFSVNVSVFWL